MMSDISKQDFQSRMEALLGAVRACTTGGVHSTPTHVLPIEYHDATIDTLDAMGVRYLCTTLHGGKSFAVVGLTNPLAQKPTK